MEQIRPNFDQDPNDTRQYKTHAAWCRYLASRGSLSPFHKTCCHAGHCTSADTRAIVRRVEAAYSD